MEVGYGGATRELSMYVYLFPSIKKFCFFANEGFVKFVVIVVIRSGGLF